MSGRNRPPRDLSDDDRALWEVFTKPIKPIKRSPKQATSRAAPPPEEPAPALKPRSKSGPIAAAPAALPPPKSPPPLAPLGRREKTRVARGHTEIDGRLDLHGHTQEQAHAALLRYVRSSVGRDARLILVITGKSGVLRSQVPQWLALPDLRAHVVGFDPAAARHGGDGALYVRLRRLKQPAR